MMLRRFLHVLLLLFVLAPVCAHAEEQVAPDTSNNPSASGSPDLGPDTAPILSENAAWAGAIVITIAGLFVAAAVIGPIVRAEGESIPSTFSHHEDPTHHTGREPDPANGAVE